MARGFANGAAYRQPAARAGKVWGSVGRTLPVEEEDAELLAGLVGEGDADIAEERRPGGDDGALGHRFLGDSDGGLVQQLQVEQELRGLGLENDYADRLGGWLMDLLQGREQLSQQNEQFLAQLQFQMKQANKGPGILDIIGAITGGVSSYAQASSGGR